MKTLLLFESTPTPVPQMTAWMLADLSEARGRQGLFTRQSPQKLKSLREHALIESSVSSNRIEGVSVAPSRIGTLVFGKPLLRDREEEEVRGYRDALEWVHEKAKSIPFSEATILRFHALSRGESGDAGVYKKSENDIIEKYPDGRQRVRFQPVRAAQTASAMKEFVSAWERGMEAAAVHPLLLAAASNLDFLCIHPFRDGNGRTSRLLFLLQAYRLGFDVGRYISLERLIEQNKTRYYETLELSSRGWHDGKHDPWPYISFMLYILKSAYKEFEARVGDVVEAKGAKAEVVELAVRRQTDKFKLADIERLCPGISREWIRTLLGQMKESGEVTCLGKGPAARWRYCGGKGSTSK